MRSIRGCLITFILLVGGCSQAFAALEIRSVELSAGAALMQQTYQYLFYRLYDPDASVLGPAGGVSLEIGPKRLKPLSLRCEALYFQKGFSDKMSWFIMYGDGEVKNEPQARYLSIPVTVKVSTVGERFRYFLFVGPSVEVLLAHDDFTVYEHMRTLTLGLHMGAGVSIEQFSVGLRYLTDLTNSYDKSLGGTLESVTNKGWALLLGLDVLPFFK